MHTAGFAKPLWQHEVPRINLSNSDKCSSSAGLCIPWLWLYTSGEQAGEEFKYVEVTH